MAYNAFHKHWILCTFIDVTSFLRHKTIVLHQKYFTYWPNLLLLVSHIWLDICSNHHLVDRFGSLEEIIWFISLQLLMILCLILQCNTFILLSDVQCFFFSFGLWCRWQNNLVIRYTWWTQKIRLKNLLVVSIQIIMHVCNWVTIDNSWWRQFLLHC